MSSRWARTLTTEPPNPQLDLADYVGQRRATFTFHLVDAITGYREEIHPIFNSAPSLSHDTGRTIMRQVDGIFLSVEDTAKFNSISSRLEIQMLLNGVAYPLGRYIPNGQLRAVSTAGTRSFPSFYDESFIVDQEITASFGAQNITGSGVVALQSTLETFLKRYPIRYSIEPSNFAGIVSWPMGTRGGFVVQQIAIDGDWFSPWMDHNNVYRFIRTINPQTAIPTLDFDSSNKVFRDRVLESDNLIEAPNRFVVISNGASSIGSGAAAVVGTYDVPASAPHSIANRGFIVQKTVNRQLDSLMQAQAVAANLGQRYTIFETAEVMTAPDPRHDSYDVIRWRGENWLEIAWRLPLLEGSQMHHVMRRNYGD